ncbi:DUF378 domain-containing protein [Candidatus Roizmanbacteria bacterium]|nr:DUF378 domain-containing protein [Candidatus Roizmanbacteria bacterium]
MNAKWLHMAAFLLVVVGALNWGLVGLLGYNLVDSLLGAGSGLTKLVYVLVGVGGVWLLLNHGKDCKVCK